MAKNCQAQPLDWSGITQLSPLPKQMKVLWSKEVVIYLQHIEGAVAKPRSSDLQQSSFRIYHFDFV